MAKFPISVLEVLEARIAPATFHWATNGDGNWNDPANWYNETTNTAGDGFPNAASDIAEFEDILGAVGTIRIPDGVTIAVNSIMFDDDFGYRIVGEGTGKLRLSTITVRSTNTATQEIHAPIEIAGGGMTVSQGSTAPLILTGSISGTSGGGIQKTGAGTLRLSGATGNTYLGPTTVLWGTLELSKANGLAVPGSLIIADQFKTFDATVRLLGDDQVADLPLNIYSTGTLDLNGFDETVGRLFMQSGSTAGSTITTGTGTLKIGDLSHSVVATGAFGARISGKIDLGTSSRDFTVTDGFAPIDLLIDADITAAGGAVLGKEGMGHLQLDGTNTLPNGQEGYGVLVYRGTLGVEGNVSGTVFLSSFGTAKLSGEGTVSGIKALSGTIEPGTNGPGVLTSDGNVDLGTVLNVDINSTITGSGYDQLLVTGTVQLSGSLVLNLGYTPANGDVFTIIDNDGTEAVQGFFDGIAEGAFVRAGDSYFQISYAGGDGNDVTLEAIVPEVNISANGKIATFTDVDGDLVTIKTTRGSFQESDFQFIPTGNAFDGQQLSLINLSDDNGEFANADLTITAKRGVGGGNGFVNVGYINATGVDLGKVTVAGDLGQIDAGDGNKVALKSLTVGSLGQLNITTQGPESDVNSTIAGTLGTLVVKGDVRHHIHVKGSAADSGSIGKVTVGGSLRGGSILADYNIGSATVRGSVIGFNEPETGAIISKLGNIGPVKISGSLIGGSADFSGSIVAKEGSIKSVLIAGSISTSFLSFSIPAQFAPTGDGSIVAGAALGPVVIRGDVTGNSDNPVTISAGGSVRGIVKGVDIAIQSVAVTGRFEWARVLAGYDAAGAGKNADASIGTISVAGDWVGSSVLAGVGVGEDRFIGTSDDAILSGSIVKDDARAISQIASVVIKGQTYGVPGFSSGILAEQIKSARIGDTRLPLSPLPRNADDFFPLATTGSSPIGQSWNFALFEVIAQPA